MDRGKPVERSLTPGELTRVTLAADHSPHQRNARQDQLLQESGEGASPPSKLPGYSPPLFLSVFETHLPTTRHTLPCGVKYQDRVGHARIDDLTGFKPAWAARNEPSPGVAVIACVADEDLL